MSVLAAISEYFHRLFGEAQVFNTSNQGKILGELGGNKLPQPTLFSIKL